MLCGCVIPGQSTYINDPFTGGVDSSESALLHISMPPGLQFYPSHSSSSGGARREGLETWRGYVDEAACARQLYDALRQAGWNLRMSQTVGSRALYIYEKASETAAVIFQAQGMLTIVQIWAGARLGDGAELTGPVAKDGTPAPSAEEYAPETGAEERWGLEEKEL